MWLKKRFNKKFSLKVYEISLIKIGTIFLILFLIQAWPRFRSDAMSISWQVYLILTIICIIPLIKRMKEFVE